jgi:hypothetical protein
MPNASSPAEHKQTTIIIGGQQYVSKSFISLNDVIMFTEYLTSGDADYCRAVADLIHSKILCDESQRPSVDQIATQDDVLFASYINSLLEEDNNLKSSYEKFAEEEDICYRLILSVDDEWKEFGKSLAAGLQKIKIPEFNFSEVQNNLLAFSAEIKAAFELISNISVNISDSLTELAKRFGDQIKTVLSDIHIPTFSEEKKLELRKSFQQWGEYGWTCIPHATLSYYNQSPESQKSANKAALALCGAKEMEGLFSRLRRTKGIKKSDLEEAIFDFQHKKYKSCSMIIFSMIDSKLIRFQRDEDRNPRTKRRYSGKKAAEKLQKHIQDEQNIEQKFFLLLVYENLFVCIQKVFEDGDDFKNQPAVINRNFIDHGMLTRSVVRKDCVQLYLLFYNLIDFLDIIDD